MAPRIGSVQTGVVGHIIVGFLANKIIRNLEKSSPGTLLAYYLTQHPWQLFYFSRTFEIDVT